MNDYQFGNFLYEKRTAKGLSQAELGAILGVSNKAVSKWENGAAKPQTEKLLRLAEILGVSVEELLSGGQTEAAKQVQDDPQRSLMIGQWMHTCRLAKIFAWLLVGLLVQIPFGTGLWVSVLKVNDDVGAAYVLCTMLSVITAAILTAVYGISQKRQRRMILRLWGVDPVIPPSMASVTPAPSIPSGDHIATPLSSAFRYGQLRLERREGKLLLWWLILATIPVFAYISLFVLSSLGNLGWEALYYVILVVYLSGIDWLIVLPVYTLVSIIVYHRSRARLISDHREKYLAYREEKKRTATKKNRLFPVVVPLYFVMLVLSAVRLYFEADTPLEFWPSAALFVLLFSAAIVMLSILIRRITKQMQALASGVDAQS